MNIDDFLEVKKHGDNWRLNLNWDGDIHSLGTWAKKGTAEIAEECLRGVVTKLVEQRAEVLAANMGKAPEYEDALLTVQCAIGSNDDGNDIPEGVTDLAWHFINRVLGNEP